jgi:hypothetical protein
MNIFLPGLENCMGFFLFLQQLMVHKCKRKKYYSLKLGIVISVFVNVLQLKKKNNLIIYAFKIGKNLQRL